MHFCQMLLNGGELDGVRILVPQTVKQMTTASLPPGMRFAGVVGGFMGPRLHPEDPCVWAFDLMELNGEDLRPFPLVARKRKLELIVRRHDHPYMRHSEPFKNGEQLLAECGQRGLEGIVSKRKHSPYKSGKCDWVKVKCAQWREDKNRSR
jgi:hypothetical protein